MQVPMPQQDRPVNLVIFSDLDGTILDRRTFEPGAALEGIEKCRALGIPLVLVSSKTRMEIEEIRSQLSLRWPFISENGGGLFIPAGRGVYIPTGVKAGPYWCICAKVSIDELRQVLYATASRLGIQVESFGNMRLKRVSEITGLTQRQAALARQREFDEPFIIVDETPAKVEKLRAEFESIRLRYNYGGTMHHLTGNFNKGERVLQLQAWYRQHNPEVWFAGIGNAYNDLPMLAAVDLPYLVEKPDRSVRNAIPGLRVTSSSGPEGFTEAIADILNRLGIQTEVSPQL